MTDHAGPRLFHYADTEYRPYFTTGGLELQAITLLQSHTPQVEWLLRCEADRENLCPAQWPVPSAAAAAELYLNDNGSQFRALLCARASGVPVGMLQIKEGQLSYLVDQSNRRLGIAKASVTWLIQSFRFNGACLRAQVARDNMSSQRTLESAGFRFVGLDRPSARARMLLNYVCWP